MTKLNTEILIIKFKKRHGNKYDYSKVIYIDVYTNVIIICTIHGEFEQLPHNHLNGCGCPICKAEKIGNLKRSNDKDFIQKAIDIYGNKNDYSKVNYVNSWTKVCVTCLTDDHGDFWVTPNKHLSGRDCPKCYYKRVSLRCRSNKEEFIQKAFKVHNDRFDYSLFDYINNSTKGKIICNKCKQVFEQTPGSHLIGRGCPRCKTSKGELALEAIFKKHDIIAIPQFKLPYHNFEYDFYLPDHKLLIEFHGRQHYEPVEVFGGLEGFKETLRRDAEKRSLAWDNKIPLLEIHYKYLKVMSSNDFEKFILNKITGFMIYKQLNKGS